MRLEEESMKPACGNPRDNQKYDVALEISVCGFEGECKYKIKIPIFMKPICTYAKKESRRLSKIET